MGKNRLLNLSKLVFMMLFISSFSFAEGQYDSLKNKIFEVINDTDVKANGITQEEKNIEKMGGQFMDMVNESNNNNTKRLDSFTQKMDNSKGMSDLYNTQSDGMSEKMSGKFEAIQSANIPSMGKGFSDEVSSNRNSSPIRSSVSNLKGETSYKQSLQSNDEEFSSWGENRFSKTQGFDNRAIITNKEREKRLSGSIEKFIFKDKMDVTNFRPDVEYKVNESINYQSTEKIFYKAPKKESILQNTGKALGLKDSEGFLKSAIKLGVNIATGGNPIAGEAVGFFLGERSMDDVAMTTGTYLYSEKQKEDNIKRDKKIRDEIAREKIEAEKKKDISNWTDKEIEDRAKETALIENKKEINMNKFKKIKENELKRLKTENLTKSSIELKKNKNK